MDSLCDTTSKMTSARHNGVGWACNFAIRTARRSVKTAAKCSNNQFPDESDAISSVDWGNFHETRRKSKYWLKMYMSRREVRKTRPKRPGWSTASLLPCSH